MQYGHDCSNRPNDHPTISMFLQGIKVKRSQYRCSGIQCCEYATKKLYLPHTSWGEQDWLQKMRETTEAQRAFMEEWSPFQNQEKTLW